MACATGCVLWSSKSQFMPSRHGRCGFHLGARTCGVGLEVLVEQPSELFRGSIVRSFVGPAFARPQNFRRHAGALNDDLETEYWIARGFRLRESAAVNSVDDRACVFEADAFAGAVSAAGPPGVDQPDARLVLSHLFRKQLGVFARMPDEKWSAEARRKCRLWLGHAHLGARDLGGVAADEMIHRMRRRERADRRQHAERIAGEKDYVGRMARHAGNLRVLNELDRIRSTSVFRDARVGIIDIVVFIEHDVLEHSAEAQRLKDVRLVFWREIDRLCVAAAFDVEDARHRSKRARRRQ